MSLQQMSLDRIDAADLPMIFKWRNHPEVMGWCRQTDALHWSKHLKWFEWQADDPCTEMYAVRLFSDKRTLTGVCGLTTIDMIAKRAEFSLYIDPEQQGKGYGEEALRKLLDKAFFTYNLNVVWGETFEPNPAQKMFEKVGFQFEGKRRQFYFKDGKYIDALVYSILRSEWEALKAQS